MLSTLLLIATALSQQAAVAEPTFSRFPAVRVEGRRHTPQIQTAQQRQFRTVLRNAMSKGYGVVEGGTEHERTGPNFAGHFVLVQWSCGLDCTNVAVIDAVDGTILILPSLPGRQSPPSFLVEMGSSDLRNLQFRTTSRLLRIPNAPDGRIYNFVLDGHTWRALGASQAPRANRARPDL